MLDGALHGTCAELGVVAHLGHEVDGSRRQLQLYAVLAQHAAHGTHLQLHHLTDFVLRQRQEHDGLVHTVQELGPYLLLQHGHDGLLRLVEDAFAVALVHAGKLLPDVVAAEVRGHDDDGVFEVHRAPLVVGQTSVVEHLQQGIEHVGVGLLNLVEQHHRVGFPPDGLGELSALLVADVSWRRSDESRHAELLLILAHVDARHHALVVEEVVGQRLRQLGLAHARGAQEDERADGALGVLHAGTAATDGVGYGADGLVLPDDTPVQLVLEAQQLRALALHHAADGDARPAADDVGNIVGIDLLLHQRLAPLLVVQTGLRLADLLLNLLQASVAYLCHTPVVALALGTLGLGAQLFHELLLLLDVVQQLALALPLAADGLLLPAQVVNF